MKNLIIRSMFSCLLLCLFYAGSVLAVEVNVPLQKFMAEIKPMRMGNQSGSATLSIPLAKRFALRQVKLHLVYTNSIALTRDRSSLAISVNGKVVKQIGLEPSQPDSVVDVDLPVGLFNPGYNKLSFSATQHYKVGEGACEDALAPELWTEVDTIKSVISFDGDLRRVNPVLSDLEHYFDPKLSNYWKLNVLAAQSVGLDAKHLGWGNLAVQGVATRLQYVPMAVQYSSAEAAIGQQKGEFSGLNLAGLDNTDSVLVGTADELAPYLGAAVKSAIQGAFLGLYPLNENSGHVVLVISGRDDNEVGLAALAFAHSMVTLPDAQSTVVQNFVPPRWQSYDAAGMVRSGENYSFKQLGLDTKTVSGFYASEMELDFSVPNDMYLNEHEGVKLDLHLNYGAGLRSDSVVNVMLNNHFVTAIHLDAPHGAELRHYEVVLPARSLLPGKNVVKIQPVMTQSVTGNCVFMQDRNLILTVYGDSVLKMPKGDHYAELPNLALMATGGFPYSVLPNGAGTQVWLPNVSSSSASAAMTLLGRLAQQTGIPLTDVSFLTGCNVRQ